MCVAPRNLATILVGLSSILTLACSDSTSPRSGAIQVTVVTTGASADRDPDGYTLSIDDSPGTAVDVNAVVTIADVAVGTHVVRLDGLQSNCSPSGSNPRTVEVTAGGGGASPVAISFFISCVQKTGTILVSTVTSGSDTDPDGYTVIVGGFPRGTIPANGTLSVGGLSETPWGVTLIGVSVNCTVDAPQLKTVNVTSTAPVQAAFTIRCVPTVSLQVTMSTTGVDLDSNGYTVRVQLAGASFVTDYHLPTNGTATVTGLAPGNYVVTLFELAPNCDAVLPNPHTVAVAESPSAITLEVTCQTGRQLAFVNGSERSANIHVINSNNAGDLPITTDPAADINPAWSPDGTKLAFASDRGGNFDIYVMSASGANPVRLTLSSAGDLRPAWSPDGARIAFVSDRDGNTEIYVMNADGSSQVRITNASSFDIEPAWSPDGTKIAFASGRGVTDGIWVMGADGSSPTQLTTNFRGDWQPAWSPDGSRIAFSRGVSTIVRDIFIMNADGTGVTSLTQGFTAQSPSWSPDGRKIALSASSCDDYDYYYYYCDYRIMIVGLDGTVHSPLTTTSTASNPTWRP